MKRLFAAILAVTVSPISLAVEPQQTSEIQKRLSQAIPGLEIHSIRESTIPGLFEVHSNNQETLFVSQDGKYFVAGSLYEVKSEGIVNLSEVQKEHERAELLAAIPESQMVVFKPKVTKAKITVFTDVDCGYCRKLHKEVARMNELGIQVNYMAYPRAGIGSDSYNKLVSVWCSSDPKVAMTDAKNGQALEPKTCDNPVAAQFDLGNRIGVAGTPAIVLDDGRMIPGYVPADTLAKGLGVIN